MLKWLYYFYFQKNICAICFCNPKYIYNFNLRYIIENALKNRCQQLSLIDEYNDYFFSHDNKIKIIIVPNDTLEKDLLNKFIKANEDEKKLK